MCKMVTNQSGRLSIGNALSLSMAVAVYSMSGIFTKLASCYEFVSLPYIACLLGVVFVLGIYAVLWQIILKRVSLSQAYPFRSLGIIYSLGIACFAFHEDVTVQNVLGACIVLCGLSIMSIRK